MINDKLGVHEDIMQKNGSHELERRTALDWKRVEYQPGNFICHNDSNFDKELDKVGYLQDKNNDYLAHLVNHQKTLV